LRRDRHGAIDADQLYYDYVAVEIGAPQTSEGVDMTGIWLGTWQSSSYGASGTFTVDIIQNGSTLSGRNDVPQIGMSRADLKGTVTGNAIEFGDIDDEITFSGTVSGSSSASGTYRYPSLGDNGSWQGTQ
jgi:hypothetical protein